MTRDEPGAETRVKTSGRKTTGRKLVLGSFDAEKYWRAANHSSLPAIVDPDANNIVLALDELLFPLCDQNDVLFTWFKMDGSFLEFLRVIGISFSAGEADSPGDGELRSAKSGCIFELLHDSGREIMEGRVGPVDRLEPYAVSPHTARFCRKYDIEYDHPDIEIIKKVNSKIHSTEIHDRLDLAGTAWEVLQALSITVFN